MKMNFVQTLLAFAALFFSCLSFATSEEMIEITVIATDKAAAVGYLVEGKKSGGLGKIYSGKGPTNKQYFFGYREKILAGKDVRCGSIVLNKSSKVQLITKGEHCYTLIN